MVYVRCLVCYDDQGQNKIIQMNGGKENFLFIVNWITNTMSIRKEMYH